MRIVRRFAVVDKLALPCGVGGDFTDEPELRPPSAINAPPEKRCRQKGATVEAYGDRLREVEHHSPREVREARTRRWVARSELLGDLKRGALNNLATYFQNFSDLPNPIALRLGSATRDGKRVRLRSGRVRGRRGWRSEPARQRRE